MDFDPLKTKILLISLKRDTFNHPTLFMNNFLISEVSSLNILGSIFNVLFTWVHASYRGGHQLLPNLIKPT